MDFFISESVKYSEGTQVLSSARVPPAEFTPMVPVTSVEKPQYASGLRFTFWISFAEIYNELIFDLLDPSQCISASNLLQISNVTRAGATGIQKNVFSTTTQLPGSFDSSSRLRKKQLDLRTDKNGNIFIKGECPVVLHVVPLC